MRPRHICGGSHATLEAAEAALDRLPPVDNRGRAVRRNRAAEQRRLRTVLPEGTDLTGVYADPTGWVVRPWINGASRYVGHFSSVHAALTARDASVLLHSTPNPP